VSITDKNHDFIISIKPSPTKVIPFKFQRYSWCDNCYSIHCAFLSDSRL